MRFRIFTYLIALLVAVGCSTNDDGGTQPSSKFGTLNFGEEQIHVNMAKVTNSEDWLLVVISPLTDASHLTTNAIIGLKRELLGGEVDITHKYCNADYIIVYEDPQCYYAPFRPLQSGTITMEMVGNSLSVEADVVLFDGTPLRYSHESLPME